jgi:VanZ family protein
MRFLRPWLPVLFWMAVIFLASTDVMSAVHTSRFIVPFLLWLKPDIAPATILQIHFLIRKGAHVTEYAILAFLLARAVEQSSRHVKIWKSILIALVVAAFYAASDEFHQSFIPSRGACVEDVLIDITGALLGLAFFWVIRMLWSQTQQITGVQCGES